VSVGRLPQDVLLEESYRNECSGTLQVGRVRVFEELPAVFNCNVLRSVIIIVCLVVYTVIAYAIQNQCLSH
jgi:hypothetical protein